MRLTGSSPVVVWVVSYLAIFWFLTWLVSEVKARWRNHRLKRLGRRLDRIFEDVK